MPSLFGRVKVLNSNGVFNIARMKIDAIEPVTAEVCPACRNGDTV